MKKVNIIHIYKDFDTFNGLVSRFFVIVRYLDKTVFSPKICVYNYQGGNLGKEFMKIGGKLENLNLGYGIKGTIKCIRSLSSFLKKERPHIVVTHDRRGNFFGVPAARLARVPIVISTETTLINVAPTLLKRIRDIIFHPILLFIIQLSDAFIINSESIKKQWMLLSPKNKAVVIYPPLNVDKYQKIIRSTASRKYPVLGFIGRLSEEKGLKYLIKAIIKVKEDFPNIELLVAGTGNLESYYKYLVQKNNLELNITFLGFQENSFEVLNRIDILIVPSRSEGFGNIALEGMAMGIPVIATKVGGLKELISTDAGLLVGKKDVNGLARAILFLIKNPSEMKRMGEAGHTRAFTEFTPENYISRLEDLYRSLIKKKAIEIQ